jgi:hypothetical protein
MVTCQVSPRYSLLSKTTLRGTIKNATVKAIMYQNIDEMKQDLNKFLIFYNFNRGHGGLRCLPLTCLSLATNLSVNSKPLSVNICVIVKG